MAITAKQVADLRAKTGCGMMECKKALTDANGDFDEAVKLLREKGLATAAKKADRIAAEGVVAILREGNVAAMVEVNAETDFVAKNDTFVEFVNGLLRTIIALKPADVEALKAAKFDNTADTVADALVEKIATIKENISIRRFLIAEGNMSTYIHGAGQTGVIVTFDTDADTAATAEFAEMAKNVALQVAAMNCEYVDRTVVPAERIAEEKSIIATQIKNDPKNASKPEAIIEKMAAGKLGKFYEQNCLTDQAYVKDDSMKVKQYVDSCAKEFGGKIAITGFERFERGEGIEKKVDNLDEEVAKMLGK